MRWTKTTMSCLWRESSQKNNLRRNFKTFTEKFKPTVILQNLKRNVFDTLMAFRSRFEHNLKSLKDEFEEKIRLMREFNREDFKKAEKRLDNLEAAIEQEISDRVTETDQIIGET